MQTENASLFSDKLVKPLQMASNWHIALSVCVCVCVCVLGGGFTHKGTPCLEGRQKVFRMKVKGAVSVGYVHGDMVHVFWQIRGQD